MNCPVWNKVTEHHSADTSVMKFSFENPSAIAETVLYGYPDYQTRTVICCSTQSGCPIGCRFCGAGDNFVRNLTAEEIAQQPIHALESQGIDAAAVGKLQIMFMAMGEPMLNMRNLIAAMRVLHARYPNADLLVSTSAPDVDYAPFFEISREIPKIGLQYSVHESTDEARNELIPFAKKLTLEEIACDGVAWFLRTGRRPFFNYCVHEGNNTDADVERLVGMFLPEVWEATISVICESDETMAASHSRQRELTSAFVDKMLAVGFSTRMFDPAGQDDIGGGCGQLWKTQAWMRENAELIRRSAGTGRAKMHAPHTDGTSETGE